LNANAVVVCVNATSLTGQDQALLTIVNVSHALFVTLTISLFNTGLFSNGLVASYCSSLSKYGKTAGNSHPCADCNIILVADADIPASSCHLARLAFL